MSGNTFQNDGSFMEQFKKLQEEQNKQRGTDVPTPGSQLAPTARAPLRLGPILKKKNKPPSAVKAASVSAKKAFGRDSELDEAKEDGDMQTQSQPHATPSSSSSSSSSTSSSSSSTIASKTETPQAQLAGRKRKRKSRWSDAPSSDDSLIASTTASFTAPPPVVPQQQQLTEEQERQLKEQIEMNKIVAEVRAATVKKPKSSKSKLEYDSDEETEDGTWEHKSRTKEMQKTLEKAKELTEMGKGKHHIGDFLPPEELSEFLERVNAAKEGRPADLSDYREHKITEDNLGYKMLQKAGWSEGAGLGFKEDGITAPVNKGKQSFDQSGVGAEQPAEVKKEDSEFELYRKRMMLAYRFRPNPLNNPRRPYY